MSLDNPKIDYWLAGARPGGPIPPRGGSLVGRSRVGATRSYSNIRTGRKQNLCGSVVRPGRRTGPFTLEDLIDDRDQVLAACQAGVVLVYRDDLPEPLDDQKLLDTLGLSETKEPDEKFPERPDPKKADIANTIAEEVVEFPKQPSRLEFPDDYSPETGKLASMYSEKLGEHVESTSDGVLAASVFSENLDHFQGLKNAFAVDIPDEVIREHARDRVSSGLSDEHHALLKEAEDGLLARITELELLYSDAGEPDRPHEEIVYECRLTEVEYAARVKEIEDTIAELKEEPGPPSPDEMPHERLVLTAYMISGARDINSFDYLSGGATTLLGEVRNLAGHEFVTETDEGLFSISDKHPIVGWLKEDNIHGSAADKVSLPDWVFDLSPYQKGLLLNRIWAMDGRAFPEAPEQAHARYYARFASEKLASRVAQLLRALEIPCIVRVPHEGNKNTWEVCVEAVGESNFVTHVARLTMDPQVFLGKFRSSTIGVLWAEESHREKEIDDLLGRYTYDEDIPSGMRRRLLTTTSHAFGLWIDKLTELGEAVKRDEEIERLHAIVQAAGVDVPTEVIVTSVKGKEISEGHLKLLEKAEAKIRGRAEEISKAYSALEEDVKRSTVTERALLPPEDFKAYFSELSTRVMEKEEKDANVPELPETPEETSEDSGESEAPPEESPPVVEPETDAEDPEEPAEPVEKKPKKAPAKKKAATKKTTAKKKKAAPKKKAAAKKKAAPKKKKEASDDRGQEPDGLSDMAPEDSAQPAQDDHPEQKDDQTGEE
jgi:hypothetical protein